MEESYENKINYIKHSCIGMFFNHGPCLYCTSSSRKKAYPNRSCAYDERRDGNVWQKLPDVALDSLSKAKRGKIIELRDTYDGIIRKVVRRGKDIGYFPGINEKIAGFLIASMITRTRIWFHSKGELSVSEVADFIFEFALNGLRGEEANVRLENPKPEVKPGKYTKTH